MNNNLIDKFLKLFKDEELKKQFTFTFNPPPNNYTIEEIVKKNIHLNKLPKTYLDFLKITNGCVLFNYLGDDLDGFHFLNIEEIIQETIVLKEIYEDCWLENIIIFAIVLGEGNYIGFKLLDNGCYQLVDCFHEEIPTNWQVIGTSFEKFLEKLIDANGTKYWLEEGFSIENL